MKKFLAVFGVAGLVAGMMMIGGCGSDDSNYYHAPIGTVTTTAATVTTTAATVTTTTASGATTTTTAPTTTTTTLPSTVNVIAGGSSDASATNVSYVFAAGTYTYTIAGFNTGDKLTFPAGATPTVFNNSWTDGNVNVLWAFSGQTITVTLTGQTANDSSLNSIADFNTVFGAGTIN